MARIHVLIVEDSVTMRKYLVEALEEDPDFEVVAEAGDGREAIELCQALRPDVVSMDMMLPVMTGLAATEYIMAYCPMPILVVSASFNRGEVFKTYQTLNAGAVDVLEKPSVNQAEGEWKHSYRQALRMVTRVKVITHPRARLANLPGPARVPRVAAQGQAVGQFRCVAIGASTGGPAAVVKILQALPANFPLPILLVIHIGAGFEPALADWLNTVSPIPTSNAVDGQLLPPVGVPGVIIAPADRHLIVRDNRLWTTPDLERHFCRPSVDVLFESLAKEMGGSVIACLLTGIGRDGAEGLLGIRRAGGMTIAQDEQSCVVYGMPRQAIELDAARQVLGLDEIAPFLGQLAQLRAAV